MNDNGNVLGKVCFNAVPVLGALFIVLFGTVCLFAQTAMVTNNYVGYPDSWRMAAGYNIVNNNTTYSTYPYTYNCTSDDISAIKAYLTSPSSDRSFYADKLVNRYGVLSRDPWVNSALIEFDQQFNTIDNYYVGGTANIPADTPVPYYPNHCLTLCAEVTCANPVRKVESSDSSASSGGNGNKIATMASGDFPIQSILFDIFKYQANANPYSPDSTPPIRTIAMYPVQGSGVDNICKGVPVHLEYSTDTTSGKSCCDDCTWPSCNINSSVCENISTYSECADNSSYCSTSNFTCTDKEDTQCHNFDTNQSDCTADSNCQWKQAECITKSFVNNIYTDDACQQYLTQETCDNAREVIGQPCKWDRPEGSVTPKRCMHDDNYCQFNLGGQICVPLGDTTIFPYTYCEKKDAACYNSEDTCGDLNNCASGYCDLNGSCSAKSSTPCGSYGSSSPCNGDSFCSWSSGGCTNPGDCFRQCQTNRPSE